MRTAYEEMIARVCRSRSQGSVCRDVEACRAWRLSMAPSVKFPSESVEFACPHDHRIAQVADRAAAMTGTPPQPADDMAIAGRKLWAELHRRPDGDAAFIAEFSGRIPCGDCRRRWRMILAEHPPRFGPQWFAWTVEAHNRVNAELGREPMKQAFATALWAEAKA